MIAGAAQAGKFNADCSGWSDDFEWCEFRPANFSAVATLQLWQDGVGWVDVDSSADSASADGCGEVSLGGTWSGELDGTYRAVVTLTREVWNEAGETETLEFYDEAGPFVCSKPPPPPPEEKNPARTPGYWKNHPESWPVTSLTIGGTSYSQACLLDVLDLSTRSDVRIPLIHHLIAAKLNVLPNSIPGIGGTDPSIQPVIDAGDAFLAGTTINCSTLQLSGSAPRGAAKDNAESIKDALDDYNNNVDYGSSGSSLTAEGEGGCTAMSADSHVTVFGLPLLALFFLRRARRRET